jgi:hypothetical protein
MDTRGEVFLGGAGLSNSITSASSAGTNNTAYSSSSNYNNTTSNTMTTSSADQSSFMDASQQSETERSTTSFIHNNMTLTAKPHAFAGAVLSPKHARELTPSLCLAIASALAEQSYRKTAVPYTLWITEAWRVLGWAEPSAALFWEMAST